MLTLRYLLIKYNSAAGKHGLKLPWGVFVGWDRKIFVVPICKDLWTAMNSVPAVNVLRAQTADMLRWWW